MDIPASISDSVNPLDRARFLKVRDEHRPSYDRTGLKLLREKAGRERDVRELYRNRAPYELLQNADDVGARRATFILTPEGVAFAHDGKWFTVANFVSLADGWSDKDPRECIGHKGLGFRSVLDITPAPHIVQIGVTGFFGFKFTWALNNGHIQETFRQQPKLEREYREWTQHGQSVCPVMCIPGEAKRLSMGAGAAVYEELARGRYGGPLTTMFWFPAKDPDAAAGVVRDLDVCPLVADERGLDTLRRFLDQEVSVLLPFMSTLEDVSLHCRGEPVARVSSVGNRKSTSGDEVHVKVSSGKERYDTLFFQIHAAVPIPPNVKNDAQTPRAVRQMKNASVRLSVRLADGHPEYDGSSRFHVYFPTEEPTGFGFTIHGDFYVKPDRTRLMGGAYNDWLLGLTANRVAGEFLTRLLERYDAKAVFESLRPSGGVSHEIP